VVLALSPYPRWTGDASWVGAGAADGRRPPVYRAAMAEQTKLIPGAEPLSHAGGPVGVLVSHGFTGNPGSVRPLAEALVDAGFTVEMPLLPGHGTVLEDMVPTRFEDWSGAIEEVYLDLAGRCEQVVVAGLSMGGTLSCWLAARHPEVAGLVCINAAVLPTEPEAMEMLRLMIEGGEVVAPGIGSDIADPDAVERAYDGSPLECALSLFEAVSALQPELPRIGCPVLIMTSPEDHVVNPAGGDHLAELVAGPVEQVSLDRSYHVATLDHDKDLINERTVEFVRRVTGGG
jgi:carboxylesterase